MSLLQVQLVLCGPEVTASCTVEAGERTSIELVRGTFISYRKVPAALHTALLTALRPGAGCRRATRNCVGDF